MKIRFQADADIDPNIRKGLLRREPSIDFQPAAGIIPDGTLDPEVLEIGADADRVLVSGDIRTMSVHFQNFVATRESPGVLLIPSSRSIGAAIEGLLGRPVTAGRHAADIRKLHRAGVSTSAIARQLQIGRTSVRRILAPAKAK